MFNQNYSDEDILVKIEVKVEDLFMTNKEFEDETKLVKIEDDTIIKKEEYQEDEPQTKTPVKPPGKKRGRKPKKPRVKPLPGIKNVVKNYGKAMCSFAASKIAEMYLTPLVKKEKVVMKEFVEWIQNNKEGVEELRA